MCFWWRVLDRHFGLFKRRISDCCRTLSTPPMSTLQWPRPMGRARAGRLRVGGSSRRCDGLGRSGGRAWGWFEGGISGKEDLRYRGFE